MLNVEPESPPAAKIAGGVSRVIDRLASLLRQNKNFRAYLASRALAFMGNMAMGFLAVYAIHRFDLPDSQAAVYTAVMTTANTLGYAAWGTIGDMWGYKRMAEIAALLWIFALASALLAPSGAIFYLVFVLLGLSNGGFWMADFNIAMEFGQEEERTAYIGLTRTLTGPVLLVAPLIGGLLVRLAGYPLMFVVSLGFAVLGLATLWKFVAEPRWADL
jgi:MFS family permease